MVTPADKSWDFRWNRRDLAAMAGLCVLAAALLAARAAAGRAQLGETMAVFPDRMELARERIDPNTAPAASLRRLGGIGPAMAARIVEYRKQHPDTPFRSADDLQAVSGIGPRTVDDIRPSLEFPSNR